MGLRAYIIKRVIYTFILIIAVITVNFIIFNLMPGNPLETYVASLKGRITPEQIKRIEKAYGLDKPLLQRYFYTVVNMLTFNFGKSWISGEPFTKIIATPLVNTLILMGIAEILSIVVGMLIGVICASKRGGKFDSIMVTASLATYSVPIYFIAWTLILIFGVQLKWFPIGGMQPHEWGRNPPSNIIEIILGRLPYLALPVLTLFLFTVGGWILLTRATVLEVITEDYVVTARAKGLSERTVLYKHVLKNAAPPLITNIVLALAGMIGGAIITETVFSYNGMGLLTWHAIFPTPDIPLLNALFYVMALAVIIGNFIADLLYGVLDPRIRYG
jgi:peptide/nickel transport system permease protein